MLPKGLKLKDTSNAFLDLYSYGSRYFTKGTANWFEYYEELTVVEQQQLFGYFAKHLPGKNPLENAKVVTEDQLKKVTINNFPKIQAAELVRLLKLYQHYCKGFSNRPHLEVGALLFYNPTLNLIKFILPSQTVTSGNCKWDLKDKPVLFLDPQFNDGENTLQLDQLVASGWTHVGTTHSHNTINCTWSSGPTGDYANQAGSKEKPLPPALHLLVYAMRDYQDLTKCPNFSFLSSVNVFGDLIDVDPFEVLEDQDVEYGEVDWIGGEAAEKLAKVFVYPIPAKSTYTYSRPYQTTYYLPPVDNTVVDAEATVSYIRGKSTYDEQEASHRMDLAVELVQDLSSNQILETIGELVKILENSAATYADIYADVIKSSYILEEGMFDFYSFDEVNNA